MYLAKIYVTLKPTVNDPQGQTVLGSLHRMGYPAASNVRVGKFLQMRVETLDRATAESQVNEMCQKLLANPVIEEYTFDLEELPHAAPSV